MRYSLAILAVCVTVAVALPVINKVRYDNYKVYRITPQTEEELQFIKNVESKWEMLDFWQRPSKVGRAVDVMVPPIDQLSFLNSVARPGLPIQTWISDVQSKIDGEAADIARAQAMSIQGTFDYSTYHTYDEIAAWMDDMVATYSGVTKVAVSKTYLGQTIYGLQIKKRVLETKVAYIQGGIHAREWISPATMLFLTKSYLENYGTDQTVTDMLDNFVWIIVPVFNIDGYEFTQVDRMWRKNRNENNGHRCKGVDLNRNYDYQWGGAGKTKCGQDYQGPSALSEPETSGSKDFLQGFGSNLKLFIDFHAYGQYWLYSWGYTGQVVAHPDRVEQKDVALDVENSIASTHGKSYFVGESGPDMYPATGGSEDFGYGSLGVKFSYVVELRDQGRYGFELPANQIEPTGEEIFNGMKTLGQRLISEYA